VARSVDRALNIESCMKGGKLLDWLSNDVVTEVIYWQRNAVDGANKQLLCTKH